MSYFSYNHLRILFFFFLSIALCACDEDYLMWSAEQNRQGNFTTDSSLNGSETGSTESRSTKSPDYEMLSLINRISNVPTVPLEIPLEILKEYDFCPVLLSGVPRGLSCLHCTQAEAREQSRVIASLLFYSCLKNIAVNYLVDGTFSYNPDILKEHIDLLSSNGRTPFMFFYLSNGATQRQWDRATVSSFGVRMKPEDFRRRILVDTALQDEYRSIILRLIPTLRYAIRKGVVVSLIPSLEDNLDDASFQKLFDIILETLPPGMLVSIGRNPCPGCYPGNTIGTPPGLFVEEHTVNPFPRIRNGVVSNDGREYHFDERGFDTERRLRLEDLRELRNNSAFLNNAFILWSGKRQGLHDYIPGTTTYPRPSERNYSIPGFAEQGAILQFLREDFNIF
jgi:hypothetical protein